MVKFWQRRMTKEARGERYRLLRLVGWSPAWARAIRDWRTIRYNRMLKEVSDDSKKALSESS